MCDADGRAIQLKRDGLLTDRADRDSGGRRQEGSLLPM